MAQEDFVGLWTLSQTSGTPFGVGGEVNITESDGKLAASLNSVSISIDYNPDTNVVRLDGIEGMETVMLAVFRDPPTGYRAIYGGGLIEARSGVSRLVVCAAQNTSTDLPPDEFKSDANVPEKSFKVATTSGTQFGIGSAIQIQPQSTETGSITIDNILGQQAINLEIQAIEGTDTTFKGTNPDAVVGDETTTLTVQFSLIQLDNEEKPRIFGVQVVGDPENSGVWGGDEDDPPPSPDYETQSS